MCFFYSVALISLVEALRDRGFSEENTSVLIASCFHRCEIYHLV